MEMERNEYIEICFVERPNRTYCSIGLVVGVTLSPIPLKLSFSFYHQIDNK